MQPGLDGIEGMTNTDHRHTPTHPCYILYEKLMYPHLSLVLFRTLLGRLLLVAASISFPSLFPLQRAETTRSRKVNNKYPRLLHSKSKKPGRPCSSSRKFNQPRRDGDQASDRTAGTEDTSLSNNNCY